MAPTYETLDGFVPHCLLAGLVLANQVYSCCYIPSVTRRVQLSSQWVLDQGLPGLTGRFGGSVSYSRARTLSLDSIAWPVSWSLQKYNQPYTLIDIYTSACYQHLAFLINIQLTLKPLHQVFRALGNLCARNTFSPVVDSSVQLQPTSSFNLQTSGQAVQLYLPNASEKYIKCEAISSSIRSPNYTWYLQPSFCDHSLSMGRWLARRAL